MLGALRQLPRAGMRVTWQDGAAAFRYAFKPSPEFGTAFACWLSSERVWTVSSGRAALCLILRALAKRSPRRHVIVPAYTCPTVPLAIVRAGLQVRLCDVDPISGNLRVDEVSKTIDDDTLAVVPVHMHGIPCEMPPILGLSQSHGAFVVEDCAQAAGSTLRGQRVGSFGDAAFFSLGKGKGFTAYEGGLGRLAVGGEPLADHNGQRDGRAREILILGKLLAMTILLHPRLYWMIRSLPLGWENETYAADFGIGGMGRFREGVAFSVLRRLDAVVLARREKAEFLRCQLRCMAGVQLLEPPSGAQPSYPWLPLMVRDRDRTVRRLRSEGLGGARLFTRSLNQYDYLRAMVPQGRYPNAEYLAAHLLTLPTHEYVTLRDMDRMVAVLAETASQ